MLNGKSYRAYICKFPSALSTFLLPFLHHTLRYLFCSEQKCVIFLVGQVFSFIHLKSVILRYSRSTENSALSSHIYGGVYSLNS